MKDYNAPSLVPDHLSQVPGAQIFPDPGSGGTCSAIAMSVKNIGKKFLLYDTPQHRLKEALHPFRKTYHNDFWALRDVSFDVEKGKTVGVIGRNGSGKSTLMQIICGILQPTEGKVSASGRISALLELGAGFNADFTGRQNIYMNGAFLGLTKADIDERFEAIVAFADIGRFIEQPVKIYSSGMYVRLAFAVAVCVDPEILVVDEALSVGDMAFQQKCLDRLNLLKEKGTTIILVTHDLLLTRNYCDSVVYLQAGRIKRIADAETAGEEFIKDMQAEKQKLHHAPEMFGKKVAPIRFGSAEGRISEVEVINPKTGLPVFSENDLLIVEISASINTSILHPRIVVQIRDYRGYIIYGTRTAPGDITRVVTKDRIDLRAALSLRVVLAPGEYSVTVSLNNTYGQTTNTVLDKQVGVALFTVTSQKGEASFHGIVNLNAMWEKSVSDK